MSKMEKCPVCGKYLKDLSEHLSKAKDISHEIYMDNIIKRIDKLLLESDLYINEIVDFLIVEGLYSWPDLVAERENKICLGRGYKIMRRPASKYNIYPLYFPEDRSMYETILIDDSEIDVYNWLKNRKRSIYEFYHKIRTEDEHQKFCLKTRIVCIDGNKENFLLTNLVDYSERDRKNIQKAPFVNITKIFTFDSSHRLLNYDGMCSFLHGHTYKLEVTIRDRIDLKTGMVMDFGLLKDKVKEFIIDKLDHKYLNDAIPHFTPTAENMLFWIWDRLEKDALIKGLQKIRLWETATSVAELSQRDIFQSRLYITSYYKEMADYFKWEK